jgi:hypothetical protein
MVLFFPFAGLLVGVLFGGREGGKKARNERDYTSYSTVRYCTLYAGEGV